MVNRKQRRITDEFKQRKPLFKKKSNAKKEKSSSHDVQPSSSKVDELKILTEFDVNWKYGPMCGITRLERWERASKFSLDPPLDVKNIILKHGTDTSFNTSLWDQNNLLKPVI
ncbi:DNA polymerase delta subunit 4 [Octopus vulgaris]|uniref:DNA polymerase delta subunit 4 n=1 Tax=Octopus vulgaris TaxID=6645 RepID=A0AA36BI47_OCTVU|nr:DNA polymerase delta subunit 4 [Octopus vulgaris]